MSQPPSSDIRIEWAGTRRPHAAAPGVPDLICLSHLRWRFVFQRPQHLMTRAARTRRVFFVEEPVESGGTPRLVIERDASGVYVAVPHLPPDVASESRARIQRAMLERLIADAGIANGVFWYWTPMALPFTRGFDPIAVVFDCMDHLAGFAYAPRELVDLERDLLSRADLVFTGGRSLYESRRDQHPDVHLFPSSVDVAHFARARTGLPEPADQQRIPRPRLGYCGVIDERMDLELIDGLAARRPDWQIVLVGPTAKIDPAQLRRRPNVHLPGQRAYAELPAYLGGWDVALLPFAHNDATRFISPTKTPEYLAAGRPVVSTSIRDVVSPYGELGLVRIADTVDAFTAAVEVALAGPAPDWLARVDAFISGLSWDRTWDRMAALIDALVAARLAPARRGPRVLPSVAAADRPRAAGRTPSRARSRA
ncbi:MAG TPA: glycosyltransferase family 1 protein [Vicinamibacterales bacterium]